MCQIIMEMNVKIAAVVFNTDPFVYRDFGKYPWMVFSALLQSPGIQKLSLCLGSINNARFLAGEGPFRPSNITELELLVYGENGFVRTGRAFNRNQPATSSLRFSPWEMFHFPKLKKCVVILGAMSELFVPIELRFPCFRLEIKTGSIYFEVCCIRKRKNLKIFSHYYRLCANIVV